MRLGTLLLRDAVISLNHLEAALRNQILYGGRLGTNLVELEVLDVDTLTRYLADLLGVPAATRELFESADETVLQSFGAEIAARYDACPLQLAGDGSNRVQVALVDPCNQEAVTALSRLCGRTVLPFVAPELRVYFYLEKFYGIERKARYVREGSGESNPAHAIERRRTQPARGIAIPPTVRLEPKTRPQGRSPLDRVLSVRPGARKQRTSYREACLAIDAAESRDAIADVLVHYGQGRFAVVVVFLIRDANAIGWRKYVAHASDDAETPQGNGNGTAGDGDQGAGAAGSERGIDSVSLPLGGASALQEAHDSAVPYRGGPTSAGKPIERELWSFLQVDGEPVEMLVVPVVVRRRVVNLIYVHGIEHGAIDDTSAKKLGELARRASRAYARLIEATTGDESGES